MIELSNFTIGYGSRVLIQDANTVVNSCHLTALLGRNGSGKSTLLRAIAGLNFNYTGTIKVDNKDLRRCSATERAKLLAYVSTGRPRISNLTCREAVAIGRAPFTGWMGSLSDYDMKIVDEMIASVGMSDFADIMLERMSDGECQRVMIARALAQQTPVILLDEPTSYLDLPNRYELCNLLRHLSVNHNKCILFSTHELDIAKTFCHDIMLIDTPILKNMPTQSMMDSGHIDRVFHLDTLLNRSDD